MAPTESQPHQDAVVLTPGEEGVRENNPLAGQQAQPLHGLPIPLPGTQMVQHWDAVVLISPQPSPNASGEQ